MIDELGNAKQVARSYSKRFEAAIEADTKEVDWPSMYEMAKRFYITMRKFRAVYNVVKPETFKSGIIVFVRRNGEEVQEVSYGEPRDWYNMSESDKQKAYTDYDNPKSKNYSALLLAGMRNMVEKAETFAKEVLNLT